MRRRFANLRWRFWSWVSGLALVKLGHAALDRDDLHEAAHIQGMVQLGDTSFCRPGHCVHRQRLVHVSQQWDALNRDRRGGADHGA